MQENKVCIPALVVLKEIKWKEKVLSDPVNYRETKLFIMSQFCSSLLREVSSLNQLLFIYLFF